MGKLIMQSNRNFVAQTSVRSFAFTPTTVVFYRVPCPYSPDQEVVVYGEPDMGAYEWRHEGPSGVILHDTKTAGYGSAEVALRDALIAVTA